MIVLCTPKGWTCPKEVDGVSIEGTFRAHQVPVADVRGNPGHLKILEDWLRSYRPEELFDQSGRLRASLQALSPTGARRMSANPHANGGLLLHDLNLPDFRRYGVTVETPGVASVEPTRVLGNFLRDVIRENPSTFRIVGPDETISNRLSAVFEATNRVWEAETLPGDEYLASTGPRHGDTQRASLRRMAGGIPADGTPWPLQLLRGVHPYCRFDAQPARKVAQDVEGDSMATANRLPELSACPVTSGGRTTMASLIRTPDSSTIW